MRHINMKPFLPYFVIIVAGIFIFSLFFSPAIYYDDWQNLVGRFYLGLTTWVHPESSRPFREISWKLLFTLFGFNPSAILIAKMATNILSTLLLYRLFTHIQPGKTHLALGFALLSMVYPADKTRMWMVITNFGWTISCLSALLLYYYVRKGEPWLLLAVAVGYIFVDLEYEGPLGITTAWALLLMVYTFPAFWSPGRRISWRRWAGLAVPLAVFGLYLFYRLVWVDVIGIGGFHQIKFASMLPLARNLLKGFRALAWGWFEPLHALFPQLRLRWLLLGSSILFIIWAALSWGVVLFLTRRRDRMLHSAGEHPQTLRPALLTILAGLILAAAGYFPFIVYCPSGTDFFTSRFNVYALVGASLLIVGILDLFAQALTRRRGQTAVLFTLLILPFILLGAGSELAIQRQTKLLWQEHRQMWQGIFAAAPGIKEHSSVVIIINNTPCKPSAYGERPFIYSNMANWELSDAIKALYGAQYLGADFVYQGCDLPYQVRFREEGYNNPPSYDGVIPYNRAIVFRYDRQSKKVELIKDLDAFAGENPPEYQPQLRITTAPLPGNMRYLVSP